MKSLFLIAIFLLCIFFFPIILFAQKDKTDKPLPHPWALKQRVYLNDTLIVTAGIHDDTHYAIFLGESGAVLGEVQIPGKILDISRRKGQAIVYYDPNKKEREVTREIHAALIDKNLRSITLDRIIFTNPGESQVFINDGAAPDQDFSTVIIRLSQFKGDFNTMFFYETKMLKLEKTSSLIGIHLSDDLKPHSFSIPGVALQGIVADINTDSLGKIYITSFVNKQLIVEQFSPEGQLLKTLRSPLDIREGYHKTNVIGQFDHENAEQLFIAVNYLNQKKDRAYNLYSFDFGREKVTDAGTQVIDHAYSKALKEEPGFVKLNSFRQLDELTPCGLISLDDKIFLWQEIRGEYSIGERGSTRYYTAGNIINVYDRQLKHTKTLFLDRNYEVFVPLGRDPSICVINGTIWALANELVGPGAYGGFFYVLDPQTLALEKRKADWGNLSRANPMNTYTAAWFPTGVLVTHDKPLYYVSPNTILDKISYPDGTRTQSATKTWHFHW